MNTTDEEARARLLRLIDAHLDDVMNASPEEIVSEARDDGHDLAAGSKRVDDVFRRAEAAVGLRRMEAARAAAEAYRSGGRTHAGPPRHRPANDAERLTLAARNGKEQSERDKLGVQDDLDDLDAFDGGRAPE